MPAGAFRAAMLAAACLSCAAGGVAAEQAAATVLSAEAKGGRSGFMLSLEMDARPPFRVFTLDDPPRVVADFPRLEWRAEPPRALGEGWLASGLRFGLLDATRSRIVIDLARPARVDTAAYAPGSDRFEIALRPTGAAGFAAGAGWPEGAAPARPAAPAPAPGDDRPTVVVDAGHGGLDPGAIRGEVMEKDIALAFARDLRDALEAHGRFRAVMTREEDVYLGLRDRVRLAEGAGGDVLLSIHVNTVEVGDATGASIHTLSETASDEEAAALAAFENRSDILAGVDLEGEGDDVAMVLIDLARRRANGESRRLARLMIDALAPVAPMLRGRAHSRAGFRVLKSPDMASALLELGFMSNETDLENLTDPEWRARVSRAVVEALDRWADAREARARGG